MSLSLGVYGYVYIHMSLSLVFPSRSLGRYMNMRAYDYIYINTCTYICICTCVGVGVHIWGFMMYACVRVCLYVGVYTGSFICYRCQHDDNAFAEISWGNQGPTHPQKSPLHIHYRALHMFKTSNTCTYVCIHTYTQTHTYICIHSYIHVDVDIYMLSPHQRPSYLQKSPRCINRRNGDVPAGWLDSTGWRRLIGSPKL